MSRKSSLAPMALVVLLVTGVLVAVAGPAPASATHASSIRAAGFHIKKTRFAAGTWLGSYRVGHEVGYRFQPARSGRPGKYAVAPVALAAGSRKKQEAAWILSNYGAPGRFKGVNRRLEDAAVDAATYTLMAGGKWGYTKSSGKARIAQSHNRQIRSWTRSMLKRAKQNSGRWTSTVTVVQNVASGSANPVTFTARNTRTHDRLPQGTVIAFDYAGSTTTAKVQPNGTAVATITVHAGSQPVTAWIKRIPVGKYQPEWRLSELKPADSTRSGLLVAGTRERLRATTAYVGATSESVAISPAPATLTTPAAAGGTYTLSGASGAAQQATFTLYGPLTSKTSCSGTATTEATRTVSANGTGSLPAPTITKAGYYSWRVTLSGDSSGDAQYTSPCSATFLAQSATAVKQSGPGPEKVGNNFKLSFAVSGFTNYEAHSVAVRLYGPFTQAANVSCSARRLFRTLGQGVAVNGNGNFSVSTGIGSKDNVGYYVWQTTLSNGTLMKGSVSSCGERMHVTS